MLAVGWQHQLTLASRAPGLPACGCGRLKGLGVWTRDWSQVVSKEGKRLFVRSGQASSGKAGSVRCPGLALVGMGGYTRLICLTVLQETGSTLPPSSHPQVREGGNWKDTQVLLTVTVA